MTLLRENIFTFVVAGLLMALVLAARRNSMYSSTRQAGFIGALGLAVSAAGLLHADRRGRRRR